MTFISGFLVPVPVANKQAYIDSARAAWGLFREYGAISTVETWESEVPDGEVTSFPLAVKRQDGEAVVFSWIVWPDKATADACWGAMESDPRWRETVAMPFDGKRMIFGGFEPVFEG